MADIIPTYTTSNPPPAGISITYDGNNYSGDNSLPIPASESDWYTGIDVPSYFLPEGSSLPP